MSRIEKKKAYTVFGCTLMAAGVFALFLAVAGIFPFGENSILRNDALPQYAPLLHELAARLKGGGSLLYSFTDGAGSNFFATMCYYLINPFNLVALFFRTENIGKAFELVVFLQTICTAASFGYYLTCKFNKSGLSVVVFSVLYTFCGFYMAYYYNTMWLNAMIFLPLIALGIERIIQGKSIWLYLLALTGAILTSFYMGYMLCLFSVLYFLVQIFANPFSSKEEKSKMQEQPIGAVLGRFAGGSLLAGLLSAVVLLPVYCALQSAAAKTIFPDSGAFFNFLDFLSSHLSGIKIPPLASTGDIVPNVFCGMLTFCLLPLFFLNKKMRLNEKLAYGILLAVLGLSFALPALNMLWHGFAAPSMLPYRFSYIYCFLLVVIAYKTFLHIKAVPLWAFAAPVLLTAGGMIYANFGKFDAQFSAKALIVSGVALGLYLIVLLLKKYNKLHTKAVSALLLCMVIAETAVAQTQNFMVTENIEQAEYPYISEMRQASADLAAADASLFYRTETSSVPNQINFPGQFYNTNSVTSFSSLNDSLFSVMQYGLGNQGNLSNYYAYVAQTAVYNALFNVKYVLDVDHMIEAKNPYYEKIGAYGGYALYQNIYVLPLGFMAAAEIADWEPNGLAFTNQNLFWNVITQTGTPFKTISPTEVIPEGIELVGLEEITNYLRENTEEDEPEEHDADEDGHHHKELSAADILEVANQMGGMYPFKVTENDYSVEFVFTTEKNGELYLLQEIGSFKSMEIIRADGTSAEHPVGISNAKTRGIIDAGHFEAGEQLTVRFSNPTLTTEDINPEHLHSDSILLMAATLDDAIFKAGYEKLLQNGTLTITEYEEDAFKGTVNAAQDGVMMLSMPYDKGWTVTVDGVEAELIESKSHILMFAVSQGEHTIEMRYMPAGLKEGAFVSVAALFILLLAILLMRVRKNRAPEFDGPEENPDASYVRKAEEIPPAPDSVQADTPKSEE